jgi:hypothetical protein
VKAFSETDLTVDLKQIDVPTLVIHGDDDQIVPISDSAVLSSKIIVQATLMVYSGAPHGLMATHQDRFNRDLLAFIKTMPDSLIFTRPVAGERGVRSMNKSVFSPAVMAACCILTTDASAQSARDIRGASPLVAIEKEPAARLVVDPPLSEPLSRGLVFIQYRTENLRVVPVFGQGALDVSPRIGHLHLTVDDLPWHFVDASGETVILVGLSPGPHSVLVELADPTHRVIAHETVRFTVPAMNADKPSSN